MRSKTIRQVESQVRILDSNGSLVTHMVNIHQAACFPFPAWIQSQAVLLNANTRLFARRADTDKPLSSLGAVRAQLFVCRDMI